MFCSHNIEEPITHVQSLSWRRDSANHHDDAILVITIFVTKKSTQTFDHHHNTTTFYNHNTIIIIMSDYKKDDEEYHTFPFQNLETSSVLQETRVFNESPIRARHCALIMTKLLYLLGQSKSFTRLDATEVFFNSTKLFISTDAKLKRMLFLLIKELANDADNSFAAANSLLKAMSSNEGEEHKANAIRTLQRITDVSSSTSSASSRDC
jgi:hypothetical protein